MVAPGVADPIVTNLVAEDKVPWYRKPTLRVMYISLFFCCMGVEMTSGFDSQLINVLQFSPSFNAYFGQGYLDPATHQPAIKPALLGFISACYQLGSIIGVPIAPWINQRFGRRWCIMFGSLTMVLGALLQGFSVHIAMYIVARMLLGFGIVFCIISGSALLGELGHPKDRATLTSLFNTSYFIGAIAASAITLGTADITSDWSWRAPSLLQCFPSLFQIIFVYLLPESPRWLVSRDRYDEAFAVLVRYHAEGDSTAVLPHAELAQIKSTIRLEMEHSKQSWQDMLDTAGMRRRVLITSFLGLFTQTSGNTLLSYYSNLLFNLMGYTSDYAKTRINLANNCWSLVNATILAFVVARVGRRPMFLTATISMLICYIAMTISFEKLGEAQAANTMNPAAQIAALFFYFAFSPCYNMGNNALTYTYLVELFPYAQRSRGIGIEQVWGKLSGFFSNYVNPLAMDAIGWKYLAITCGWLAFQVIFVYTFYPETHGRTLEELAFLFEDHSYAEKAALEAEKELGADKPSDEYVETVNERGEKALVKDSPV